jgi:hypothetical protein
MLQRYIAHATRLGSPGRSWAYKVLDLAIAIGLPLLAVSFVISLLIGFHTLTPQDIGSNVITSTGWRPASTLFLAATVTIGSCVLVVGTLEHFFFGQEFNRKDTEQESGAHRLDAESTD